VDIRECRAEDLELIHAHMPSPGQTRRHSRRFDRQQLGLSTLLIAWSDDIPVGSGEIRWHGCAAPEVAQRHPGCPELNGLEVSPTRQSQGIGTAIVHAAETLARRRGHTQLGLGVDDNNHRAAQLYLRLGYEETGCRYLDRYDYLDNDGTRHDIADPARFLIKPLRTEPS